jgi:hypothetical protein
VSYKASFKTPFFFIAIINLEFKGLNMEMFIVADNTDYFGCDFKTCYFTCVKGFTFKNVVGRPRWSNMEGLCVELCTMSFAQCGWPNWPILRCGSCWPMMYVVWAIFKNRYYVDLWSMFLMLAHGYFMPLVEEMLVSKLFCLQCI